MIKSFLIQVSSLHFNNKKLLSTPLPSDLLVHRSLLATVKFICIVFKFVSLPPHYAHLHINTIKMNMVEALLCLQLEEIRLDNTWKNRVSDDFERPLGIIQFAGHRYTLYV